MVTKPGSVSIDDLGDRYDRLAPAVACFFFTH